MIRYTPLAERRMKSYKAWYNPDTHYFRQFDTNMLHGEIAYQEFRMNEAEAIENGYYRIYVDFEVNIDSQDIPDEREFNAVKYMIEANSYKKFKNTRWNVASKPGYFWFPHQSFLFADSIKDADYKKR